LGSSADLQGLIEALRKTLTSNVTNSTTLNNTMLPMDRWYHSSLRVRDSNRKLITLPNESTIPESRLMNTFSETDTTPNSYVPPSISEFVHSDQDPMLFYPSSPSYDPMESESNYGNL
jgi:hypothetical protein